MPLFLLAWPVALVMGNLLLTLAVFIGDENIQLVVFTASEISAQWVCLAQA